MFVSATPGWHSATRTPHAPRRAAAMQLHAEQSEGDLRRGVGTHRGVAPLDLDVVEIQPVVIGGQAALQRDASAPGAQERKDAGGERGMAEEVRLEVQFEAVCAQRAAPDLRGSTIPAFATYRSIGRPSRREGASRGRRSTASEARSRSRRPIARPARSRGCAATAASPFVRLRTGRTSSAPARGKGSGDLETRRRRSLR